jgi:ABC-type proline/glycine betaine transport system ATPase subunit
MSTIVPRINRLMKFVNLDLGFKDKYPHQFSGGEQQRIGMHRAMILEEVISTLIEKKCTETLTTKNRKLHFNTCRQIQ